MKVPGVPVKLPDSATPYLAIGAVVVVLYFLAKREAASAVHAVAEAVNPVSDQNIFYKGTNAVGKVVSGDESFSLGSWLWEALHPATVAAEQGVTRNNLNPAADGGA